MSGLDLLVVGPAGRDTGGIARYIAQHRRVLPDGIRPRTYDVAPPREAGTTLSILAALADAARFPFRRRPDVVHVHTSHYNSFYLSAFYVFVASLCWRRPVVVHVHGSSFDEFVATDSPAVAGLQAAVFAASDRVVVLSEYWRDTLGHRVADRKLVVLPNAVSPDGYDPSFDADPPRVAFVSNHVERKGIREFTAAVSALLDDGLDFEVTIAGSGPLSDRAERLAASYDAVSYVGYVPEREKRELLSASSIYVLPTHAEGLPIALLEGMAGGNALVSTRVGSIPDVVDDENGELVAPGDADALREALRRLIADPERVESMGRTNRDLAETTYSWDRSAERLARLYAEVCDDTSWTDPGEDPPTSGEPAPGEVTADPVGETTD